MILPYSVDKLFQAISGMAESTESIQRRVLNAWIGHLHILDKDHFRGEELEMFVNLEEEATRVHATGNEGNLAATLLTMSDEDARAHASKICTLYYMCILELKAKDVGSLE